MFTKTFKLAKYPDSAKLNGAEVTWQNPSTVAEALAPGGGFKDEAALIAAANAYRDVQVGHKVRRDYEKAVKDNKPFTLADAIASAAGYQVGDRKRRSGVGGSRKPKLTNRVNEQKFRSASKAKLDVLLEMGSITEDEYKAEMDRRAAEKATA